MVRITQAAFDEISSQLSTILQDGEDPLIRLSVGVG